MKKVLSLLLVVAMLAGTIALFASCKKEKVITVGYTVFEPMNYPDENGKLVGFDTELAEKVFGAMGYKVIFKEIKWENKYTDLASGTIDCVWNGFTANCADDDNVQRSEKVDFSYNYMKNRQVVVVKNTSGIATAADLVGKVGVAEAGSAGQEFAESFEGTANIKKALKQTEALLEVNTGSADFAVVDTQLAESYCGKGDYASLTIVSAISGDIEYYAIGFKKGSDLTAKVNEQLEKLGADGTITELAKKYGVELTAIIDFSDQKK